MKNKILIMILVLTNIIWANFNFAECSGSKTFQQEIKYWNHDNAKDIEVGDIPVGIKGLKVELQSDKDVDIRLFDTDNNQAIVAWSSNNVLQAPLWKWYKETKTYEGVTITYSGYNGVNKKSGYEFIEVAGTTPVNLKMKAFGYQAGYATVNYSWTGKEGCSVNSNGSGNFKQNIANKTITTVGIIPKNIANLEVKLTSNKDIDIQLYGEDGTAIVKWPNGLLEGSSKESTVYNGMTIEWSGYNGEGKGKKGHEYIKVTPKTTEKLTMKVYAYQTGTANVTYSWGNTNKPNNYVCGANMLVDCPEDNQTCNLKTFKNLNALNKNSDYTFQYNGKCKKDTNITACTKEYAPVCGITNPCPPGAMCAVAPIYKTFGNMCMLDVANAEFAYDGQCTNTPIKKEILYVREHRPVCITLAGFNCPTYWTRKSEKGSWENFYGAIKGFNYKSNYRYKLSVTVKNIPNPPADGSSLEYTLIKVLEKKLIVPKNCIAWFDGCNSCAKMKNDTNSTYSSMGACTLMACSVYKDFKCTKYN